MKKIKKLSIASLLITLIVTLNGCALLENDIVQFESAMKGRDSIIQTYDEESNIIDKIEGKSIHVTIKAINKLAILIFFIFFMLFLHYIVYNSVKFVLISF